MEIHNSTSGNSTFHLINGKRRYITRNGSLTAYGRTLQAPAAQQAQNGSSAFQDEVQRLSRAYQVYGSIQTKIELKLGFYQAWEQYKSERAKWSGVEVPPADKFDQFVLKGHDGNDIHFIKVREYKEMGKTRASNIDSFRNRVGKIYTSDSTKLRRLLKRLDRSEIVNEILYMGDSFIDHVKLESVKTPKPKTFNPQTARLAQTKEKISSQYIKYNGSTLREVLNDNLKHVESKKSKIEVVEKSCVYTALINAYGNTLTIQIRNGCKGDPLTYESLYKFFHGVEPGKNADYTLSLEQAKRFFKHFRLKFTAVSRSCEIVFHYNPSEDGKCVNNKTSTHFVAMVSNNHIYPINHKSQSLLHRLKADPLVSGKEATTRLQEKISERVILTSIADVLDYKPPTNKDIVIKYGGSMTELFSFCKLAHNYTPIINFCDYSDQIIRMRFNNINGSILIVERYDGNDNETKPEELASADKVKAYTEAELSFTETLFNRDNMSEYNSNARDILFKYEIAACSGVVGSGESQQSIDFTKAYSSILHDMPFIPVCTKFDDFKEYNDEPIEGHCIYLVEIEPTMEYFNIISSKSIRPMFGVNLRVLNSLGEYPKILGFMETSKTHSNDTLPRVMDNIRKMDLEDREWKFIFNRGIGLTCRKYKQSKKQKIYDDIDEAHHFSHKVITLDGETILQRLGELDLTADDMKKHKYTNIYIGTELGEKRTLSNGFYLIQTLIYDTMRTKAFKLIKEAEKQGAKPVAIKTDEIYFTKPIDLKKTSFKRGKGWGCVRVENNKYPHNKPPRFQMVEAPTFNKSNIETLTLESETDLTNQFKSLSTRTLVQADLPGAGKTTSLINAFNSEKLLVVAPTNVLVRDIQRKFNVKAVTINTLVGWNPINKKMGAGYRLNAIDTVILDEIFSYDTYVLQFLAKRMTTNEEIKWLAAGDSSQNKPIEKVSNKDIFKTAINQLFPKQLWLKESKRVKNSTEQSQLRQLKQYIFTKMTITPRGKFIDDLIKYFPISANEPRYNENVANISFFNETVDFVNDKVAKTIKAEKLHLSRTFVKGSYIRSKVRFTLKDEKQGTRVITSGEVFKLSGFAKKGFCWIIVDGKSYTIPNNLLDTNFRPAYCDTGHSIQGTTIHKPVNIFNVRASLITPEWLWTAITRATTLNNVNLVLDNKLDMDYDYCKMVYRYKNQDYKAGRTFDHEQFITPNDIKTLYHNQKGKCLSCDAAFNLKKVERDPLNISVDRLDNKYAHVKGNCQLLCMRCNVHKQ